MGTLEATDDIMFASQNNSSLPKFIYFQLPTKKVIEKTSKLPAKDQEERVPLNNSRVSRSLTK